MADQRRPEIDYIGNYNFSVTIDGVAAGHFSGVDGLSIEQEVIEFQDGDDPLTRKRPGRVKFGDITLKKGYISSTVLNQWIQAARIGSGQFQRKNMSVILHDNAKPNPDGASEIKRWNCFECFPKSWKVSSLDGKGNDVMTEEIVIALEYFEEG
ncbi:MAG: phage tail protein [Bradymonadales bacterium]|nr:phage tail protein [Bradymonadales bacterium]